MGKAEMNKLLCPNCKSNSILFSGMDQALCLNCAHSFNDEEESAKQSAAIDSIESEIHAILMESANRSAKALSALFYSKLELQKLSEAMIRGSEAGEELRKSLLKLQADEPI